MKWIGGGARSLIGRSDSSPRPKSLRVKDSAQEREWTKMDKFKFDSRMGRTSLTFDFYDNPWKYSFVHNFKVHYKSGLLQALANKLDISLSTPSADMPSTQDVMNEFNDRMKASIVVSNTKKRFSQASYHVTQIEYKESLAFYDAQTAPRMAPQQIQRQFPPSMAPRMIVGNQTQAALFCRRCGASLPADSAFCAQCGERVI